MILDDNEKQRRFLLRAAGARDGKVYIGPEMVHLLVTNRCNLSCRYCLFHSPGNPVHLHPRQDMSFDKFREIIGDCVDLKVDALELYGSGEPTCHPRFADMMTLLERQPLAVTVLTNGTFPLKRCRDVLKADRVRINFSAVDRESYRLFHGKDLFNRAVENIRQLARLRDAEKRHFEINIVYVTRTADLYMKHKAGAMAKKLGADSFSARIIQQEIAVAGDEKPVSRCFNGWFSATIDGKIRSCYLLPRENIASLERMSFREAWLSPEFMETRLAGRCGRLGERVKEGCHQCRFSNHRVAKLLSRWGVSFQ